MSIEAHRRKKASFKAFSFATYEGWSVFVAKGAAVRLRPSQWNKMEQDFPVSVCFVFHLSSNMAKIWFKAAENSNIMTFFRSLFCEDELFPITELN